MCACVCVCECTRGRVRARALSDLPAVRANCEKLEGLNAKLAAEHAALAADTLVLTEAKGDITLRLHDHQRRCPHIYVYGSVQARMPLGGLGYGDVHVHHADQMS